MLQSRDLNRSQGLITAMINALHCMRSPRPPSEKRGIGGPIAATATTLFRGVPYAVTAGTSSTVCNLHVHAGGRGHASKLETGDTRARALLGVSLLYVSAGNHHVVFRRRLL